MADPRKTVVYDGIDYQAETFMADASIVYDATKPGGAAASMIGKAVARTGQGVCGLIADGQPILGKLLQVEHDGACTVQTGGYVKLPGGNAATFSATAPERAVGALGPSSAKGYIRAATTGDEIEAGAAQIIDATSTANVVVRLI